MNEEGKKEIEQYLADTIIGRPHCFFIGERQFAFYPVTLGKMYLLQPLYELLEINQHYLQLDVSVEALRLAQQKKKECLTIICYHTCHSQSEVFNAELIQERMAFFEKELSQEDIAALMILVLTSDKTAILSKYLGIDKEQERLGTVMRIKSKGNKNNLTFGGKSIYGTLIDAACERYGWTKEYVVWGIDYTSLRLMLADKVNSVYCSDDEVKKIPPSIRKPSGETIKAGRENIEHIKNMDWS